MTSDDDFIDGDGEDFELKMQENNLLSIACGAAITIQAAWRGYSTRKEFHYFQCQQNTRNFLRRRHKSGPKSKLHQKHSSHQFQILNKNNNNNNNNISRNLSSVCELQSTTDSSSLLLSDDDSDDLQLSALTFENESAYATSSNKSFNHSVVSSCHNFNTTSQEEENEDENDKEDEKTLTMIASSVNNNSDLIFFEEERIIEIQKKKSSGSCCSSTTSIQMLRRTTSRTSINNTNSNDTLEFEEEDQDQQLEVIEEEEESEDEMIQLKKEERYPLQVVSNYYKLFKCIVKLYTKGKLTRDQANAYLSSEFIAYSRMSESQLQKCIYLLKTRMHMQNSKLILELIDIYLECKS